MSQTQFDAIQQQLTAARKALRERNTLLDHLARLDDELAGWQDELAYLEKKVFLEQKDVEEVSGEGIAAALLWLTGKREAVIAKEEQELAQAIEAYETCRQKVEQMQAQQEAWEHDLVGLAEYDEEIAQLEQAQFDLILTLPTGHTVADLASDLQTHQQKIAELQQLIERCELVELAFADWLDRFQIGLASTVRRKTERVIKLLDELLQVMDEAKRPFWTSLPSPFFYMVDMIHNQGVGPGYGLHVRKLREMVQAHHNAFVAELADRQQQAQHLALEKESLISQLWKRENFA